MAPMAEKLHQMLEKSKDDGQLKSIANKRHITSFLINFIVFNKTLNFSDDDINEIIRITNGLLYTNILM